MAKVDAIAQTFLASLQGNDPPNVDILSDTVNTDSLAATLALLEETKHSLTRQLVNDVQNHIDPLLESTLENERIHTSIMNIVEKAALVEPNKDTTHIVSQCIAEHQTLVSKVNQNKECIQATQELHDRVMAIEELRQSISMWDFTRATQLTARLQDLAPPDLWAHSNAGQLVKDMIYQSRQDLVQAIQHCFDQAIVYSTSSGEVVKMHVKGNVPGPTPDQTLSMRVLFDCAAQLDILSAQITRIKKTLFDRVLTPLFTWPTVEADVEHEMDGGILFLSSVESDNAKTVAGAISKMEQANIVLQVLTTYLFKECDPDTAAKPMLGRAMIPELNQMTMTVIRSVLDASGPSLEENFDTLAIIRDKAVLWEEIWLDTCGLETIDPENSLSYAANHLDAHIALKRRENILSKARQLIMCPDYNANMVIQDSISASGERQKQMYQITSTPKLYFDLIRDTYSETRRLQESHAVVADKLLDTIDDLVDLYLAISPLCHRAFAARHPERAHDLGDDCYWLADQLMLHHLCARQDASTEADYARRLRTLGETWHNFQSDDATLKTSSALA